MTVFNRRRKCPDIIIPGLAELLDLAGRYQRAVSEDNAGKVIRNLKGASISHETIGFVQ